MNDCKKERALVLLGSPCDTNMYPDGPSTVAEVKKSPKSLCPRYAECAKGFGVLGGRAMQEGRHMAKFILQGGTLSREKRDFQNQMTFGSGVVWSSDRVTFEILDSEKEIEEKVVEFAAMLVRSVGDEKSTRRLDK